jgi:hypothetical protein
VGFSVLVMIVSPGDDVMSGEHVTIGHCLAGAPR